MSDKKKLPVDLVVVDGSKSLDRVQLLTDIAQHSCKNLEFNSVKIFTGYDTKDLDSCGLQNFEGIEYVSVDINSIEEYSLFVLTKLKDYITASHCLIYQHDGFILHPDLWNDEFLNYDYIGAVFDPGQLFTSSGESFDKNLVGNGGFSLRSKKLMDYCSGLEIDSSINEDKFISVDSYDLLISEGYSFAPPELACYFSIELPTQYNRDYTKCFGFHGNLDLLLIRAKLLADYYIYGKNKKYLDDIHKLQPQPTPTKKLGVVLLATYAEFKDGLVDACLRDFFAENCSTNSIPVHLYFNRGAIEEYERLYEWGKLPTICDFKITVLDIPEHEDIYFKCPADFEVSGINSIPELGGSSGPNTLFFDSMLSIAESGSPCRDILMLECDTRPIADGWIDRIIDYCDNNTFMIAGSLYRGEDGIDDMSYWSGHLNGVALYRFWGSPIDFFLKNSRELIKYQIAHTDNKYMSFDVGMHTYRCSRGGIDGFFDPDRPQNHIINCPVISNYSRASDVSITESDIKEEYPDTVILHQKRMDFYKSKLILLTTMHPCAEDRSRELAKCLKKNIENTYIEKIVILSEHSRDTDFGACNEYLKDDSVLFIQVPSRPTYYDFIAYANHHFSGRKIILANTDIYFDDSLDHVISNHTAKDFYALTRWMFADDGKAYLPNTENGAHPIDKIDPKDLIGLRWWTPALHPEHRWYKNETDVHDTNWYSKDCDAEEDFCGERWLSRGRIFNEVFDFHPDNPEVEDDPESTEQLTGTYTLDGKDLVYRNEYSQDAWIFEAPYTYANDKYKFPIGVYRCDTMLAYHLISHQIAGWDIRVTNPCLDVKSYHEDYLRSDLDRDYENKHEAEHGKDNYDCDDLAKADSVEELESAFKDYAPEDMLYRCFIPWRHLK